MKQIKNFMFCSEYDGRLLAFNVKISIGELPLKNLIVSSIGVGFGDKLWCADSCGREKRALFVGFCPFFWSAQNDEYHGVQGDECLEAPVAVDKGKPE